MIRITRRCCARHGAKSQVCFSVSSASSAKIHTIAAARVVCGARVTSDGHLTRRQDIIKNGALVGWTLSQYGAKKTGLERSGNVSGNIVAGTGDKSLDELVSGIENGLLMNRFSGGYPSQNGDFTGIAKNSFLIKNGKITDAVSETMVSGNLLDMINNVAAIGREAFCDGGGALPFAAFNGITISGE
jgi:PmbA protein